MFSDVSDDEPDGSRGRSVSLSWPCLQLYEEEEFYARAEEIDRRSWPRVLSPEELRRRDHHRKYLTWRFLHSIVGFHMGDLDLSGRHLPRYEKLINRWKAFWDDFRKLSRTVELHDSGDEFEYILRDLEMWNSFAKKWHVSRTEGFGVLVEPVDDVLQQLLSSPQPKIQVLCLHDLPTEILDNIFQCSEIEEARSLSSVCRRLRSIGRPYIFTSRSLYFNFPSGFSYQLLGKSATECIELISSVIDHRKEILLSSAKFLISRKDVSNAARSLAIENSVKSSIANFAAQGVDHDKLLDPEFYLPIYNAFEGVIRSCINIHTLTLSCVELNIEILQAISTLSHLTVLEYDYCTVSDHVQACIYAGWIIETNRSVKNLVIRDTNNSPDPWALVELYPNLRTLFVGNMNFKGFLEPPRLIIQQSRLFTSLERLSIDGLCAEGIMLLEEWIRLNAAVAPLQLTHLKITAPLGIPDFFLFSLVDALQTAPLQVLALDGISDGSLELFDTLAEKLPQLLGLTLMRRENDSQIEMKAATWPHATFEYAAHFSGFRSLEHFSWNFRVSCGECTPAYLTFFEEGQFPTPREFIKREIANDYVDNSHDIAYPFAAHCVTLKSLGLRTPPWVDERICLIKRKDYQRFELDSIGFTDSMPKWNIPDNEVHWPYIYPERGLNTTGN